MAYVRTFYILLAAMCCPVTIAISDSDRCLDPAAFNATFMPPRLPPIKERKTGHVTVHMPIRLSEWTRVEVASSDQRVVTIATVNVTINVTSTEGDATVTNEAANTVQDEDCQTLYTLTDGEQTILSVMLVGIRLGNSEISISFVGNGSASVSDDTSGREERYELEQTYPVVVLRNVGILDRIFHIVIQVVLAILNFAFGCELDLMIIWNYIKKPLAPSIGIFSQFLLMPLLGLTITQILRMDPVFGIGLIALACAPGGGASNAWAILLGGDVNLSLTMTFLSLTLGLGLMPLWMFMVSRLYLDPSEVKVPYLKIFTTLISFVGPCFVGVVLKKLKPKIAQPITKVIKPLSILFLLWVLTLGTYVNLYMWKIMGEEPTTIAAGILLPWFGFLFGFTMGIVSRQGKQRAITIAIETGIQNMGVPIVLLQRSFPQPQGDLAATMVNSVSIFTPIPLFIALITLVIRRKCCNVGEEANLQNEEALPDSQSAMSDMLSPTLSGDTERSRPNSDGSETHLVNIVSV